MDYYPASVQYPITAFVESAPIPGSPPEFWTAFTSIEDARATLDKARELSTGWDQRSTPLAPSPTPESVGPHSIGIPGAAAAESDVERIARQRVQVLARVKMESQSTDLLARLEILNAKLARALPRVTPAQVAALEKTADAVMNIRAAHAARMERLRSGR